MARLVPAKTDATTITISETQRRVTHVVYVLVAVYALAMSLYGLSGVVQEIGQPFGGFLWGWDPSTQSYAVAPYTPWNWPGPAHGLERDDRILAVNGRPPDEFPFVLIFPTRLPVLDRRPWLVWVPYAGAAGLMGNSTIASSVGGYWNTVAFALWLSSVLIAGILVTVRSLWAFVRERGRQEYTAVAPLGIALAIGVLLALGAGILPFLGTGPPALATHLFLPLGVVYPIILVYAVRNARLVRRLQRQLARERQLEAETRELRNVRKRTLREIATMLHDSVVPDIRGLQF